MSHGKNETEIQWLAEHFEGGSLHGRIGRRADANELVADWLGVARLEVRRDGTDVRFSVDADADPSEAEKIRSGSANALLRHLQGAVALHGSAVAIEGSAIAFVGAADSGKSTLAASLSLDACATTHFLADDVVTLDESDGGFDVIAFEQNHWLDAASCEALGLVHTGETAHKIPVPARIRKRARLAALAHLIFADVAHPRISKVSGVEAFATLLPQILRFVVDEPEAQRHELEVLAALVATIPVVRIERRRGFDQLAATRDLVSHLLRCGS